MKNRLPGIPLLACRRVRAFLGAAGIMGSAILGTAVPGAVIPAPGAPEPPATRFPNPLATMRRLEHSHSREEVAIWNQIQRGPADLKREQEIARREGIPTSPRDLERPSPPLSLNAAPDYQAIRILLQKKPLGTAGYKLFSKMNARHNPTLEELTAARKLLIERREAMDLIHRAADKPCCVFQRHWSNFESLGLLESFSLREATRLLRAESYLMAREGRPLEAITNMARGFQVARHLASERLLISYLTSCSCHSLALEGMKDILYIGGDRAAVARRVQEVVSLRDQPLSLRTALGGEVALEAGEFQTMKSLSSDKLASEISKLTIQDPAAPPPADTGPLLPPGLAEAKQLRLFLNHLLDASHAVILHELRGMIAGSTPVDPEDLFPGHPGNPVYVLPRSLLPIFVGVLTWPKAEKARQTVVIAGAALLVYRGRHGTFPVSLGEAMPRLPMDPFSQRPLQYRREGQGFVVYSVGRSGHFSGSDLPESSAPRAALMRYPLG